MQRINEDIKNGNFRQMYLLYGEEAYLRKQYRDRLKKAMISDDDTMNYSYLEGKDISIGAVIDLAETLPFLRTEGWLSWKTAACSNMEGNNWPNTWLPLRKRHTLFLWKLKSISAANFSRQYPPREPQWNFPYRAKRL